MRADARYRVDPASGAWTHEQLLEIVNPSFLTLDRAQSACANA